MKLDKKLQGTALACAVMLLAMSLSSPAQAQHRRHGGHHSHHAARVHFGVGVYLGGPIISPWFYPPPYAYYPRPIYYHPAPVIIAPQSPPVYIEREATAPAPAPAAGAATEESQSWWYYCGESKTYYPYVKTCPGGWQRVSPTPPPG